jgi:CRP/FNR family cyclic AMP-dependent transcriptional regulator
MTREAIRSLPLFEGLARDDVELLAQSFQRESFPAGMAVFGQGDRAEKLYVLISGRVAIRFKPYDGDVLPVTEVGPGGVFGWSAALNRPCYTSCAIAVGDCQAISISGDELRRLCRAHPQTGVVILERLAGVIAERLNSTHAKVIDMLQEGMQAAGNG